MLEQETPQHTPKAKEPKGALIKVLSHPVVVVLGIVGAIASLISIPLAIYLYLAAKEYSRLTYYVNPAKTVIVRAGEASRLTVSFDEQPITTDITGVQVTVWNDGRRAIRRDNILQPFIIYTENHVPILEASIRRSSREVTQLVLNTEELRNGRVTVSWNILEHNDGGVIQLIYAGNTNLQIHAEGVVEGQGQVQELVPYAPSGWEYKLTIFVGLGFAIFFTWASISIKRDKSTSQAYEGLLESYDALRSSIISSMEFRKRYPNEVKERENVEQSKGDEARLKELEEDERDARVAMKRRIVFEKVLLNVSLVLAILLYVITGYLFINQPSEPPFGF